MFNKAKDWFKDTLAFWLSKRRCSFFFTHSPSGEDLILLSFFKALNIPPEKIYYLEIGTNHPMRGNNTFLLYEHGARGICVEPNSTFTRMIKNARPGDELIAAGATHLPSGQYTYYDYGERDGWNTFDRQEVERRISSGLGHPVKEVAVDMININEILKTCRQLPHLLAIDVEGSDHDILTHLDFDRFPIPVILAETLLPDPKIALKKDMRIVDLLTARGYKILADSWYNMIFYNEKWCSEVICKNL